MCVLEMSVARHPTHTTREIKPCENELKGHLLQATETLSTASSEGTKTTPEGKQVVVHSKTRLFQVVPGPSRAAPSTSTLSSRDKALRDAAKVKETQGDLPSNCWPHKSL